MKALFTIISLAIVIRQAHSEGQWALNSEEDICSLFPNGAVLRQPGTCSHTITCQDGVSTEATNKCPTNSFVLTTKSCGKATDSYCSTPCVKNSPQWVADIKNCHDWVKCNGKDQLAAGTCPSGQVFNGQESRCYYPPYDFSCEKTFSICSVSPKDQKFWDRNNCAKYFSCDSKQKLISNRCESGMYYEKVSGECMPKAQVNCPEHPVPENVCGTPKLAIRGRFVSDQATCNGYFYCKDLGSGVPDKNPWRDECPNMMFFDERRQICTARTDVVCQEDRCVGRSTGFELSARRGCQHYLKCKDGYTEEELQCEDNKYFDAESETCVDTKTLYSICS